MAVHPQFPTSPYEALLPDQRWFPADETLRETAYEKLLPPLVAKIREEVSTWPQAADRLRQRSLRASRDGSTRHGLAGHRSRETASARRR
ncbi:MAG: hypothetical protein ABI076_11060 [Acidobacteriaceae bacterium]